MSRNEQDHLLNAAPPPPHAVRTGVLGSTAAKNTFQVAACSTFALSAVAALLMTQEVDSISIRKQWLVLADESTIRYCGIGFAYLQLLFAAGSCAPRGFVTAARYLHLAGALLQFLVGLVLAATVFALLFFAEDANVKVLSPWWERAVGGEDAQSIASMMRRHTCVGWTAPCDTRSLLSGGSVGAVLVVNPEKCPSTSNDLNSLPVSGSNCRHVVYTGLVHVAFGLCLLLILLSALSAVVQGLLSEAGPKDDYLDTNAGRSPPRRSLNSATKRALPHIVLSLLIAMFLIVITATGGTSHGIAGAATVTSIHVQAPSALEVRSVSECPSGKFTLSTNAKALFSFENSTDADVAEDEKMRSEFEFGNLTNFYLSQRDDTNSNFVPTEPGNCNHWNETLSLGVSVQPALSESSVVFTFRVRISRYMLAQNAVLASTLVQNSQNNSDTETVRVSCGKQKNLTVITSISLKKSKSSASKDSRWSSLQKGSLLLGSRPAQWVMESNASAPGYCGLPQESSYRLHYLSYRISLVMPSETLTTFLLEGANGTTDGFTAASIFIADGLTQERLPWEGALGSFSNSKNGDGKGSSGDDRTGDRHERDFTSQSFSLSSIFKPITAALQFSKIASGFSTAIDFSPAAGSSGYVAPSGRVSIDLQLPITLHKLPGESHTSFRLALKGSAHATTTLLLDIDKHFNKAEHKSLWSRSKDDLFFIGDVPIFVSLDFSIDATATLKASAKFSWKASLEASGHGQLSVGDNDGSFYHEDDWDGTYGGAIDSPHLSCHAKATLQLNFAVGVRVDGLAEVSLALNPYVEGQLPYVAPSSSAGAATTPKIAPPASPPQSRITTAPSPSSISNLGEDQSTASKNSMYAIFAGTSITTAAQVRLLGTKTWTPFNDKKMIRQGGHTGSCDDMYRCHQNSTYVFTCIKDNRHGTMHQSRCQSECPYIDYKFSQTAGSCEGGNSWAGRNDQCVPIYVQDSGGVVGANFGWSQKKDDPSKFSWCCIGTDWGQYDPGCSTCTESFGASHTYTWGECVKYSLKSCVQDTLIFPYWKATLKPGPIPKDTPETPDDD